MASPGRVLRRAAKPASTIPALLPDAAAFRDRIARARARRRAGPRLRRLRCGRADRPRDRRPCPPAPRASTAIPYVPSRLEEGHGLSHAAVAAARDAGATVIVTVDCGTTSLRRDRGRPCAPASTSSSPTTIACRRCCRRPPRSSTRSGPTAATRSGGSRAAAWRSSSPSSCSRTSRAGRPRPSSWPTSRRSGASPTSSRSSARRGRSCGSGWTGSGAAPRPGIAALLASAGRRRGCGRRRDARVRGRAPDQRRRPGGGGARRRPAPAQRDPGRSAGARRGAGDGELQPARPDEAGDRGGAGTAGRRRRGRPGRARRRTDDRFGRHDRPRPVAGRDRRPRGVAARRGPRHGRRSSGPISAPVIRASCRSDGSHRPGRGAASRAATCSFATAGTPAPPASRSRRSGGRSSSSSSARSRRPRCPPDPRRSLAIDLALPALDVDYALQRGLARLSRRAASATRSRSSRCWV